MLGRNVCDFTCCFLVLCCVVCLTSSFSCLLNNRVRQKAECQTVGSDKGGRSGWLTKCCQAPQKYIKTRILLELHGCQISKYIGPFAYLSEGQVQTTAGEGKLFCGLLCFWQGHNPIFLFCSAVPFGMKYNSSLMVVI